MLRLTRPSWTAVLLFFGSALVTSLFLAVAPDSLGPTARNDYEQYYRPVAEAVLRGDGYVRGGQVNLHNPPGYPFALVALYALADVTGTAQMTWVTLFAIACTAGSTVLVHSIARRLFDRRAALVAAVLFLTYPLTLAMASYRLSEAPYTLALLIALYATVRAVASPRHLLAWATWAGFACALAALIRPAAIGLAVLLAVALLLFRGGPSLRQRWAAAALVVAGFLAGVAPWEAWMYDKTGRLIPLSEVGAEAAVVGVIVGAREDVIETGDPVFVPEPVREMSARIFVDRESFDSTGEVVARLADEPPADVALLLASKSARAFYGTDSFKLEPLILLVQLPYLALMIVGLFAARRWRSPLARWSTLLFVLVAAYSWVVTLSALSIVRYMAPALAMLMVPAAAAVVPLAERVLPVTAAGRPRRSG
jgi:4-amino-4-deoxy-L-arabinose transferase-like glycosyltransferase